MPGAWLLPAAGCRFELTGARGSFFTRGGFFTRSGSLARLCYRFRLFLTSFTHCLAVSIPHMPEYPYDCRGSTHQTPHAIEGNQTGHAVLFTGSVIINDMRLVQARPAPPARKKKKPLMRILSVLPLVVVAVGAFNLFRPLPAGQVALQLPIVPEPKAAQVAWPSFGQSAVAAVGYGELGTSGANTPLATASIAKVITALCVLEKHPIVKGSRGATITIGRNDRLYYEEQVAQNGSRLPVFEGEELSQYEAIQALMVPSANNIADTLAVWAFGSLDAYATYANAYLARNGLVSTKVGVDASGLDPSTKSTAQDLTRLGLIAAKNDVLMEIAAQKRVDFSFGGSYDNYNSALGTYGITGLKTGNTDQNPGALLFTGTVPVGASRIAISGTVMGAGDLPEAIRASQDLMSSLDDNFEEIAYVRKDTQVGEFTTKWGTKVDVLVKRDVILQRWKSHTIKRQIVEQAGPGTEKRSVADLELSSDGSRVSSPLVLAKPAEPPSLWWRLTHFR